MTVAYTDRTLPLAANSSNALAASIRLAYDFTGMGSLAEGAPYISQAASTLVKSGTMTAVTLNGIPGRQPGAGSVYQYSGNGSTDYGLNVGTGDFTLMAIVSTGATLPATTAAMTVAQVDNAGASAITSIVWNEITTGWYISATGVGASATNTVYGVNSTVLIVLRRAAGVVSLWSAAIGSSATMNRRYADVANTTAWDATSAKRIRVGYVAGTAPTKSAVNNVRFMNYALTDAEMQTVARDPWALDANAAVADSLTITSPASGASIPTTTTISGTYTGTPPTGVEVQHGASAWTALTGFVSTPGAGSSGTWSGSVVLSAASAASLRARNASNTTVVSADVTGITVIANSIAFTTPPTTTNGAVNYRLFQRDGSNQAQARITGTYSGSPTAIEWRFNGGSWATAVASPSGGTFDALVTLQGPAQGALEVRFANSTAVSAALTAVGVGDLYIPIGQSNHVGKGTSYVPPTPPAAHPTWVSVERDKTGAWRAHTEAIGQPFDSVSAGTALYAVHETSGSAAGLGSYFGQLATQRMADGVPIGFVPAALGSTSLAGWAPSSATTTLYGAFVATANAVGNFKGVIYWQGEAEAASAGAVQATQESGLNAIVNDVATRFPGKQFHLININTVGVDATGAATVRAAIARVAATNANVSGYGDMLGLFANSIHYGTGGNSEVVAVAAEAYRAITAGAPVTVSASAVPAQSGAVGTAFSLAAGSYFAGSFKRTAFALSAGALPAGLTLNTTTGAITGTPTTAGTASVTVQATDLSGATASADVNFTVAASSTPVQFAGTIPAQSGTVGTASASLSVASYFSGSLTPFTYSVVSGAILPPGLTLNPSTGAITGTPTAAGSYTATIRATDSGGNTALSNAITWTVAAAAVPVGFSGSVPAQTGTAGTVSTTLALAGYFSGSLTPFSYAVASGALPAGLALSSSTGQITGTPTTAGSFTATVRATDAAGNTATTTTIAWTIAAASGGGGTGTGASAAEVWGYSLSSTSQSADASIGALKTALAAVQTAVAAIGTAQAQGSTAAQVTALGTALAASQDAQSTAIASIASAVTGLAAAVTSMQTTLATMAPQLADVHEDAGLKVGSPVTVDAGETQRSTSHIVKTITRNSDGSVTMGRQ
jgi:hypothetical protein